MSTNCSVFTVSGFGTTFQRKFKLMYYMPALKICQKHIYKIMTSLKESGSVCMLTFKISSYPV